MRLIIAVAPLLMIAVVLGGCAAPRAQRTEEASEQLGFSGAVLTVRALDDPSRPGTARRTLTLRAPNGTERTLALQDAGGRAGSTALNLYVAGQHQFLLLGPKDCVAIDAIKATLSVCAAQPPCNPTAPVEPAYIGRFDWMNGFDPPKGDFGLRFRFLPAYDVVCSG